MECLLTTLKGTVNNDNLPKLGEMILTVVPVTNNIGLSVGGNGVVAELTNGAYFTTSESTSDNLGTTKTLTGLDYVYSPDKSTFNIKLVSKYNITGAGTSAHSIVFSTASTPDSKISVDDLSYSLLSGVNMRGSLLGSIASLLKNKSQGYFYIDSYGLYDSKGLIGDLSAFEGVTVGNAISVFSLSDTSVSGDISHLSGISAKYIYLKRSTGIHGNLGSLPDSNIFLSAANSINQDFTFTGFPGTRSYILGLEGVTMSGGVDDFLIANAALDLSPLATDSFVKKISIIGTRTTASDSAVATLGSKGVTVTITAPQFTTN